MLTKVWLLTKLSMLCPSSTSLFHAEGQRAGTVATDTAVGVHCLTKAYSHPELGSVFISIAQLRLAGFTL